jgi:hypothetical protein
MSLKHRMIITQPIQSSRPTVRVSGLVGEPTHETENALAWTLLFARPTTKSAARIVSPRA